MGAGIARERETGTADASPCQRECRTFLIQDDRTAHGSTYREHPGAFSHPGRGLQEDLIMGILRREVASCTGAGRRRNPERSYCSKALAWTGCQFRASADWIT